jgi:phosphonatase-like hydrolase
MPSVPTQPPPDLLVCDLAGTTIRDRGEVPAAFEAALREAGVAFEPAELDGWRGASKREVLGRLLARDGRADPRLVPVYTRFRSLLLDRLAASAPLSLPGVDTTLEGLKRAGVRLAVTTGFDREVAQAVFAAVSWAPLLDAWICGDDVSRGRPAPYMIFRTMERCGVEDVRRVAVVGGTRLDLEAAWNAGAAWRVGVLTGAHDRATLEAAPHTHIVDAVTALPDLWGGPADRGAQAAV